MAGVGGGFVRAADWRRVREFTVGAAVRHDLATLVLSGEAGAGKSTLWRAGVQTAADAGCRVLRSEPSASEADSSFAGLSDLLAGVLPAVGPDIPGPQREALEVALLLRPPGDQPAAAHAIGLAVLAALRSCVRPGPVLVAIDDVQWLDAGSREALAFALRRMTDAPLSLLLAARSEAPPDPLTAGAPPLRQGWRDLLAGRPAAEEITLTPLDAWQIQNLLPDTATAAQARLVARQSRGNPFWAREIWASVEAGDAPIPPLATAQFDRLSGMLTPASWDAMATVAAAGRITVPETLALLSHLPDPAAVPLRTLPCTAPCSTCWWCASAGARDWTRNCWSVPSAWSQCCRPPRCTTQRTCTGGYGRVSPMTWTSPARRYSGASLGRKRWARTGRCRCSCPTWRRPRNLRVITRRRPRPCGRPIRSPPGTTGRSRHPSISSRAASC